MGGKLFEDLVVSARRGRPATRTLALPASAGIHAVAALGLSLAALSIPKPAPPPLAPPLPAFVPEVRVRVTRARPRPAGARPPRLGRPPESPVQPIQAPVFVPDTTVDAPPVDRTEVSVDGSGPGSIGDRIGDPAGTPDGDPNARGDGGPGSGETPVVRATEIEAPRLRHSVKPSYPDIARQIRLQGEVELQCLIDTDGRVTGLTVTRGHPLFNAAAVEAVQQWVYTPTRLNGVPVRVLLTVKVKFVLQ